MSLFSTEIQTMEDDNNKKERKTKIPDKETRRSLFSAPVVIVVIVASLVGLFGSFNYSNKTADELLQVSRTVAKRLGPEDEHHSCTLDDSQAEQEQDSGYSVIMQPSTTFSLEAKIVDEFEKKKILTSADVVQTTMDRMDDTDQKEKENPTLLSQTPSNGVNTLTYQGTETLTDKELVSDTTDTKIDKEDVSLGTNKKLDTMTAAKMKEMKTEPEDSSRPSPGNNTVHYISTEPDQIDKQVVQDEVEEKFKIPRRDGIKVGHVQNIELEPGKFYDVITRSLEPPIFELPDFLAEHECQTLINQAKKTGLEKSRYQQPEISSEPTNQETFKGWDYDNDNVITPQEVVHVLQDTAYLFFKTTDIEKMFVDLNIDLNGNGVMDLDEYLRVTNSRIVHYLQELSQALPRTMHRNSRHTWLHYNGVEGLSQRVSALTYLPVQVVERSEKLQVVNYGPEGHYYCHIDSQDIEDGVPCCLANDRRTCRLCRYITVLYYLNDVEDGGETAFPVADNVTFSHEEWAINMKHRCDLSKNCHQANVYVQPRKGTAIMWYNHVRDEQTGWLGRIDPRSFHGGCDVIKGHKWIANSWINIVGESGDLLVTYHPTSAPIP